MIVHRTPYRPASRDRLRTGFTLAGVTLLLLGCETPLPPQGNPYYVSANPNAPTSSSGGGSTGFEPVASPQPNPGTGGSSIPSLPPDPAPELVCVSGQEWTKGNAGSSRMKPGSDCNECHKREGGPIYGIAGTVYTAFQEYDDCFGVPGAIVEVMGANGQVVAMQSNSAGNFTASRSKANQLTMPFTARVVVGGQAIYKKKPQTDMNCGKCHTEWGDNGADGRIVIP